MTGICCVAYGIIWPLETLKNVAQAGVPQPTSSLSERIAHLGGIHGLYRCALPGIFGGEFRYGMGMIAMKMRSEQLLGLV